jgi:hypothetical protein
VLLQVVWLFRLLELDEVRSCQLLWLVEAPRPDAKCAACGKTGQLKRCCERAKSVFVLSLSPFSVSLVFDLPLFGELLQIGAQVLVGLLSRCLFLDGNC